MTGRPSWRSGGTVTERESFWDWFSLFSLLFSVFFVSLFFFVPLSLICKTSSKCHYFLLRNCTLVRMKEGNEKKRRKKERKKKLSARGRRRR